MSAAPKLVIFNNGIVSDKGMSGSDNRAVHWAQIWGRRFSITLVIPRAGINRYAGHPIAERIITTDGDFYATDPKKVLFEYLRRVRAGKQKTRLDLDPGSLIYCSSDLIPDSLPAMALKKRNRRVAGVKMVMGCHLVAPNPFEAAGGPSPQGIYYYYTQQYVLRKARRWVDLLLVSNQLDRRHVIEKFGFGEDQVIVTHGGINFDPIEAAGPVEKQYDALFIGRNHPQKGIPDLIDAWSLVCAQHPKALLAVVGEQATFAPVKEEFERRGLGENVRFVGYLSGVEKYRAIKSARVLLFPSHYESFGMAALEGLACGRQVISYDLEIFKESFGSALTQAPLGDTEAYSQLILDAFERPLDEAASMTLEQKAREFSFERTASLIMSRLL